jgi:hypothetical protein
VSMSRRHFMTIASSVASALMLVACGSVKPSEFRIEAISNDTQEEIPCAIFIDGEMQKDAAGGPIKTPASLKLVFKDDPTGIHTSEAVSLAVYPLMTDGGTQRLPQEDSSDYPPYRFDRYAQRLVRKSDSRTQLFILLTNSDRKTYGLPRRGGRDSGQ